MTPAGFTNEERAAHAAAAIAAYIEAKGAFFDLQDLLADLQHWWERHSDGRDWSAVVALANLHYEEEVPGPP